MKKINKFKVITFGIFGFIFFHLAQNMLQVRQTGWYAGHINLYGDLVYHLSLINKFIISNKILIDSPIYANDKINYPIIPDFITAKIAILTDIKFALFITTFLVGLSCIYFARLLILEFMKNEKIVFLTLLMFFLNGGLGFVYFFRDFFSSRQSLLSFLLNMPNTYTQLKEIGYFWINNYLAYFLPQRSFLFAFPITMIIMLLLYQGYQKLKFKYFILAGTLAGILPLIQVHSLFLLFLLSAFFVPISLFANKEKKHLLFYWTIFAVITAVISYPILQITSSVGSPLKFIKVAPGWVSKENIILFWLKNLGFFAPAYIAALFYIRKNTKLLMLHIPFLGIFLLANIFIFQPWDFDNSKLLIYWYFSSCVIVAYFLNEVFFKKNTRSAVIGTILVFLIIFSGSLEIIRTFTPITNYQIFSKTDLQVAYMVKTYTAKDAIFVTASNHNHPIPALTGRSTLVGFIGWLWSHGIDYQQRESDVSKIYLGDENADNLINKYHVNFVAVGPMEKSSFNINKTYFSQFPYINLAPEWVIYDVSNLWSNSNR